MPKEPCSVQESAYKLVVKEHMLLKKNYNNNLQVAKAAPRAGLINKYSEKW